MMHTVGTTVLRCVELDAMAREDKAAQQAEIYQLEAELRAVRKAEAEERAQAELRDAEVRVRQSDQKAAQEAAARQRAEEQRDAALQQLAIIQQRFGGNVDMGGWPSPSVGGRYANYGTGGGGARSRSGSRGSAYERAYGDLRHSLLSSDGMPPMSGDVGSLTGGVLGKNDDHANEGCGCVVS